MYGLSWRILRPDAEYVWSYGRVRERLKWYYDVMRGVKPAKFLICKKVGDDDINLNDYSFEELISIHEEMSRKFKELFNAVSKGDLPLSEFRKLNQPKVTYLDIKIEMAKRILAKCEFCEWRCGVNRYNSRGGVCGLGTEAYVSSYFLHVGEESPLVPSGTIFYGSCNFRCVFCQNYDISQVNPFSGINVTPRQLSIIQRHLREEGARNINHVGGEPTPNLHVILESLKYLDINVPQLWNSNMYMSVKSMQLLLDVIDIWLPDFKYGNNECAQRLSKVKNYFDIVSRNHKIICQNGDPVIIRHLVMPNHINCCTKPILEWISSNCTNALVNIMDQYRPEYRVVSEPHNYPDIARRPTRDELETAYNYARHLGIAFEEVSR